MLIATFFSWWYGAGFRDRIAKIKLSFVRVNDQFSIPLLLKTLFQPFRQISADKGGGAIEDRMRAGFDNLVSRIIGAFTRFFVIIAGLIAFVFLSIFSLVVIIVWLLMPILPFAGLAMVYIVGVPWTI